MNKSNLPAARNNNINEFNIKLLLLGDTGVGKTCLLLRFTQNMFQPVFTTTIGIDFKVKYIDVEGLRTKLQIWDTAGQERFRTITVSYFRGAHAIMLLYDIGDRETFVNITHWMRQIHETLGGSPTGAAAGSSAPGTGSGAISANATKELASQTRYTYDNISILLVGNKSDRRLEEGRSSPPTAGRASNIGGGASEDCVTYEEGAHLAAQFHNVEFMEVSAKDNSNINEAFQLIALMTKRRMVDKLNHINGASPTSAADGNKHQLKNAAGGGNRSVSTDSVNMNASLNKKSGCC